MNTLDINDKKLQREIGKSAEGRTILCVYDPNTSLYFLTFADGVKPDSPEFQGYFTDPSRAEESARAYLSKEAYRKDPTLKSAPFLPKINPVEAPIVKTGSPAANFKKEFNKLKTEIKESLEEKKGEDTKGLVHLGSKEVEPQFEVGSLKLP